METGNVTADKIHYSRQSRATDAEIKALAEDIRDNGLHHPVLVDRKSGLLLDGLNRVLAYKMLGWSVVPALFFDNPTEATDELEKVREDKVLGYQRSMEMFDDMRIVCHRFDVSRRTGVPRGKLHPRMEGARASAKRATGISENSLNRLNMLINVANTGNEEAQKIIDDVYASPAGSPIRGFGRALELHRANRALVPMESEERMKVLSDILRAAETSLEQVTRVGGLHTLSVEDSKTLIARMRDIARISAAINRELKIRSRSE